MTDEILGPWPLTQATMGKPLPDWQGEWYAHLLACGTSEKKILSWCWNNEDLVSEILDRQDVRDRAQEIRRDAHQRIEAQNWMLEMLKKMKKRALN